MSGQIHATFSGSGFATPFPGQYGSRVRSMASGAPSGYSACTASGYTPNWE